MIFYDHETFKYDWLAVFIDVDTQETIPIVNNREALIKLYEAHKDDIWVGFNNKHYDQYIFKAILLGMNPKEINDAIILQGKEGWALSREFNNIKMINYDVMPNPPVGLKTLEGFMGSDIRETSVPFDIDRKLTQLEIEQTIKYCTHDVEQTMEVFVRTANEFNASLGIVGAFPNMLDISNIGDSSARLTARVLGCEFKSYSDEFEFNFLDCLDIKKYKHVIDWFESKRYTPSNSYEYYKQSYTTTVAGIPHTFGFGGLHGAPDKPMHYKGAIYHVDVNNYYPSLLLAHELVTRSATNDNYKKVYETRKALKKAQLSAKTKEEAKRHKKAQLPYKKMLNALSGAMKDKNNPAYDPRNNNIMCINGQLMLLDLIEHLEAIPGFQLIQSNTDGLIVQIPDTDEAFDMMDDICYEWETRCSTDKCDILLETDLISEIWQKDVNNYLWIDPDGNIERKGAYVKELSDIDYDLPIINKALVNYMTAGKPVEDTINECDELIEFQKIVKLSNKYQFVMREKTSDRLTDKSYRVFASSNPFDGKLLKFKSATANGEKFANTPDHCIIYNDSVVGVKTSAIMLDKNWYIELSKKRLKEYGCAIQGIC